MALRFDPLVDRLQAVLDLRQLQHTLTASNLANAETPGYRAKVIPFDTALADAMGQGSGLSMTTLDDRHIAVGGADGTPEIVELDPPPYSEDGNSVLPERETTRMVANQIVYSGVVRGLSKHLAMLRYAASDGRA